MTEWASEVGRLGGNRRGGLEREGGEGETDEEQAEVKAGRRSETWKLRIAEEGKGEKPKRGKQAKGELSTFTQALIQSKNVLESSFTF